ncbi:uncharacterized protein LOC127120822 isoform X6 [Lathyrus oleraceus]|uniref:uncharacterized protein LOC127120822 isoform X6 n=1 Tax=Pisum sativum TaxID=3888 RepID=UPI0021D2B936|nr:uncharacterized protein LOC127120822 isoform X6 [Pisum sativum]
MTKPERPPSSRTNLASCVVATIFLVFVFIIIFTLYFTLFKPQDPKISVTAVQLPSFSLTNNGTSANLTFSQYASVRNPNRGTFSHYDSSFQLLCYGRQIGFMFVPAGKINARRTEYMAATFTVQSLPLGLEGNSSDGVNRVGPTMEIESTIEMAGRVRVLNLFSHHVEAKAECRVAIAVADGTVIGQTDMEGSSRRDLKKIYIKCQMPSPNQIKTYVPTCLSKRVGTRSLGTLTIKS